MRFCLRGQSSWCWVQKAKAKEEEPVPHSSKSLYLSKFCFDHLQLIKGVYRELNKPELLQRCLRGMTQNPNESLHPKVWRKISKDRYCGLRRVTFVTQVTVLEHIFCDMNSNFLLVLGLRNPTHASISPEEGPKGK